MMNEDWISKLIPGMNFNTISNYENWARSFEDQFQQDTWPEGTRFHKEPHSNQNCFITTSKPRKGYINGGMILTEGVTITNVDFTNMALSDWAAFEKWVEDTPNIAVDEILDNKLLWIYSKPPVITSMVE